MATTDAPKTHLSLPTLGVVVPAYNEQDVIEACLSALATQKEHISEVIVVDNNSTDQTAAIVRRFISSSWPGVKLVSEPHPGVVSARNAGMNAATSDIVARIDADTIVLPGWAEAYRRFFGDPGHDNVAASTGLAIPYDLPLPLVSEWIYQIFILQSNRLIAKSDTLFGSNMAVRRAAWRTIRNEICRKHDLMEDMDVGLHLRRHDFKVLAADGAKVSFSARRLLTTPASYFQYARMWPMTYWYHGMKLTAVLTWPFMLAGCALQTLMWPILRSYDPVRRRLSIRRLFTRLPTRMIPKGS